LQIYSKITVFVDNWITDNYNVKLMGIPEAKLYEKPDSEIKSLNSVCKKTLYLRTGKGRKAFFFTNDITKLQKPMPSALKPACMNSQTGLVENFSKRYVIPRSD
jgi:hypothetical protein